MNQLDKLLLRHRKHVESSISLVASENYHRPDHPLASILGTMSLNDKYAEGYPNTRYYRGCSTVDAIEDEAVALACSLYNVNYANVQPLSGSQANQAVYCALLKPGDTILSLGLHNGGHLSHGHKVSISGHFYNIVNYGLDSNNLLDYEGIAKLASVHKPKIIVAGFSAFSYIIDWKRIGQIAKQNNCYFLADIAHISGLVAAKVYPNPAPYCDVISMTTHKTIGGPRGAIIMIPRDPKIAHKISRGVFPGVQGGPNLNSIAGKAWAFAHAHSHEFKQHAQRMVDNARLLAHTLQKNDLELVWSDIHTHIVLINLTNKMISGDIVDAALDECNLWCNRNQIPNDTRSPNVTSGIRLGTPSLTSLNCTQDDIVEIGNYIAQIITSLSKGQDIRSLQQHVKKQVVVIAHRLRNI